MQRCGTCSRPRCAAVAGENLDVRKVARRVAAVREPDTAVTDTHPLIFHAAGGTRLGRRATAFFSRCERREAILYVPVSVMWECSLLARVGKVNLRRSIRSFFDDLFSNPSYHALDLSADQVCLADEMRFNRDPFDGLIVAAARTLDVPMITRDAEILDSGIVKTIW
ncbi:MAG: type II toxin-antitoxin system VapC family toxin [Acidobacteria bacterium]|nr:type II toxin-antitoxin system VapC family toxin [Acidobacteriota bacterium]